MAAATLAPFSVDAYADEWRQLAAAYDLPWPLPPSRASQPVPAWWARYKEADARHMSLPEFEAWCWTGRGAYYLPRLRVGWAIEAAVEEKRWQDAKRKARQPDYDADGWAGGTADPEDSVAGWADDGDPEAA